LDGVYYRGGFHRGNPIILDGKAGFVPLPLLFLVAAGIVLLAIIPRLTICKKKTQ
jgi:hypothetical protein